MARIRPFRGFRPAAAYVTEIASLPYDVLDSEEARAEIAAHPDSFLTVTKSESTLSPGTDPYSTAVYAKARENLLRYAAEGKMRQDAKPCFYIYRQQLRQHIQIGVVAVASVEDYRRGIIRRHELTRREKEEDRIRHIKGTKAQTGPVFLTYKARPEINSAIIRLMSEKPPVYDFMAEDGVRNTVYVVDNPLEIKELAALFERVEAFYIADGHHRCAGAVRVAEQMEQEAGRPEPEAAYQYFQAVIFPDTMMYIMDYNRLVKDLNGCSPERFLTAAAERFEIRPVDRAYKPEHPHTFGMYLQGRWYALTAREGSFDATDRIASLDVSILQDNLLEPVLGIGDPRTDKRISFAGGIRGLGELEKRVDSGAYAVAFGLYPTRMQEVMAVADAGLVMPPKSTWFEPKLRDGLVVHLLENI